MNHTEPQADRRCTRCGRDVPEGTPESECPFCLFGLGLEAPETDMQSPPREAVSPSASLAPEPGDLLGAARRFGDYELLEPLGHGGMGIVYKARQISLHRLTAIKMTRSDPFPRADLLERFQREAQLVARLHHPGIVAIYEVGEVAGQPYFSMEYVEGGSLSERARAHPIPAHQAAGYVRAVSEAIHYAHQRGILHRDLKPSNILLDQLDQPKVTDFGVAKLLTGQADLTLTGQRLGSPSYMAPEQASGDGDRVDVRTDVYALGAVLYHLVVGRPPFVADTAESALAQVASEDPIPLCRLNPSLSHDLETICLKCLEKDPVKRYATAQDLAEDLDRFLRDQPILARPVTRIEKAGRWCRRNPVAASLGAAATLLLLAVAIGGPTTAARIAAQAEDNRRVSYGAELAAAWQSWNDGNVTRSIQLLKRHRPGPGQDDLREFTWGYLWGLCRPAREENVAKDPTPSVLLSAVSRDGTRFATAGVFGTVTIWNVRQRTEERRLDTGNVRAAALAFSPDGRHLVTTGGHRAWGVRGDFQVWDVATGARVARKNIRSFLGEYSPDGQWFAFLADRDIVVLDVHDDWKAIRSWPVHDGAAVGLRWSRDGTRLVSAGGKDNTAAVWHAASGTLRCRFSGHSLAVTGAAFSPNGDLVATAGADTWVRFWDAETGTESETHGYRHAAYVYDVAWSRDGTWIASASADGLVRLRNWRTRSEWTLRGHSQTVPTLHFALGGTRLVTASLDGSIRFWDLTQLPPPSMLEGKAGARYEAPTAFSPDNRLVATVNSNATDVLLWNVGTGVLQSRFEVQALDPQNVLTPGDGDIAGLVIDDLVFSAADRLVVACEIRLDPSLSNPVRHRIAVLDLQGGTLVDGYPGGAPLALSPSGKLLAMGGDIRGSVQIRNLASRQTWPDPNRARPLGSTWVSALAFSPDGDSLAVSYSEAQAYKLALLETATGQFQGEFEGASFMAPINALAFTPNGDSLLTVGYIRRVQIWDVRRLTLESELEGHSNHVRGLAVSPDGKTFATGDASGVIKFWSLEQHAELLTLRGHELSVLALTFSPDGRTLASGAEGGRVRLWRADPEF